MYAVQYMYIYTFRTAALLDALAQQRRRQEEPPSHEKNPTTTTTTTPTPTPSTTRTTAQLNDAWLIVEIRELIDRKACPNAAIVRLLHDIKTESACAELFATGTATCTADLLAATISYTGARMLSAFSSACAQHNPHIDYLKAPPLLALALSALHGRCSAETTPADVCKFHLLAAVRAHLGVVERVRDVGVRFVDADALQRFVTRHLCGRHQLDVYESMVDAILGQAAAVLIENSGPTLSSVPRTTDDVVGLEAPPQSMQQQQLSDALQLLHGAELILKHVDGLPTPTGPTHKYPQMPQQQQQQQHANNYADETTCDGGSGSAAAAAVESPIDAPSCHQRRRQRRANWLRTVYGMLTHLAAASANRFERALNENNRQLIGNSIETRDASAVRFGTANSGGKCTVQQQQQHEQHQPLPSAGQQAAWVANFVIMWRQHSSRNNVDNNSDDDERHVNNVMVSLGEN